MLGKVKWFNNKRGYGFITGANGKEYFIHQTNINMDGFRKLKDGQDVTFDEMVKEKGLEAINVSLR